MSEKQSRGNQVLMQTEYYQVQLIQSFPQIAPDYPTSQIQYFRQFINRSQNIKQTSFSTSGIAQNDDKFALLNFKRNPPQRCHSLQPKQICLMNIISDNHILLSVILVRLSHPEYNIRHYIIAKPKYRFPTLYKRNQQYINSIQEGSEGIMIESIKELCKEHVQGIETAELITVHENFGSHGDFLIVGFMMEALLKGRDVTFLGIRENYAHYLALSKKMGKSIEEFGRNGKLKYYEAFASELCSQLPLTQSSPNVFVRPPKFVTTISTESLNKINVTPSSLFIIDALSFIEHTPSTCYKLYEEGLSKKCNMIFGGCSMNGNPAKILCNEADLWIKLENDVSGHGKFRICEEKSETSVLWKWVQGKFQVSKYMKV